jgi:hypothetical protein
MSRSMWKCCLLVFALAILATGCDEKQRQAAAPVAPVKIQAAPGKLFDPLENDKDVRALKHPGRWRVSGQDRNGGQWEGYLIVEHAPESYMTTGFFEWSSQGGGGRYRFEGTYDAATRLVRWTGFIVHDRFGNVANAHYQATLSADGQQLQNGSWQGGISVPGNWTGEFLNEL